MRRKIRGGHCHDIYIGKFKSGVYHGPGTQLQMTNGKLTMAIVGVYRGGVLHGENIEHHAPNHGCVTSTWRHGHRVDESVHTRADCKHRLKYWAKRVGYRFI